MTFQRVVQTLSLACFLWLLGQTAFPLSAIWPVNAYVKLDPLNAFGVFISGRVWMSAFGIAILMLLFTLFIGRFFCGYLCPFGITLDVTDRWFSCHALQAPSTSSWITQYSNMRWIKYGLLLFILVSAVFGVSFLFLVSPVCLITQFYGLVLTPLMNHLADNSLGTLRSLGEYLDVAFFDYFEVSTPRYQYHAIVASIFTIVFLCGIFTARFWCRYLCPSGALLALVSLRPVYRRQVSESCNRCGICQGKCPMSAIEENPFITHHGECITCMTCVRICPVNAVNFKACASRNIITGQFSPHRRKFITAGMLGAGAAMISQTGISRSVGTPLGSVGPKDLLRPPGSVPEVDFLARCIRCGLCMKACPTNILQPYGFDAGLASYFSPCLKPRRGPCEPLCNVCGQVCPTNAIRRLSQSEKIWAKVGTAYILRHKCLAWEFNKKCLVCDEVCPYGAISLKRVQGISQAVPFVSESRCSGCGYCEHHCPIQNQSAIIIEPMDAVRISTGSYSAHGKQIGLSLNIRAKDSSVDPAPTSSTELPPGFSN